MEAVFGKQGHRVWDAKEARTLVFIVYCRLHFTLLVRYVDEKGWEFYNNIDRDCRSMKNLENFISLLHTLGFLFTVVGNSAFISRL